MPNPGNWPRDLEGDEPLAIGSRNRFDLVDGGSEPGIDGRGHSHRVSNGRKGKARRAADIEPTVGGIVVHVALSSVSLAPGVLMRSDVLGFSVVSRPRIQRCVQIGGFHQHPVRRAIMRMASVVGRGRWISARKGIHPGARTQTALTSIQVRPVRI